MSVLILQTPTAASARLWGASSSPSVKVIDEQFANLKFARRKVPDKEMEVGSHRLLAILPQLRDRGGTGGSGVLHAVRKDSHTRTDEGAKVHLCWLCHR